LISKEKKRKREKEKKRKRERLVRFGFVRFSYWSLTECSLNVH
jgi:hypothetical protein